MPSLLMKLVRNRHRRHAKLVEYHNDTEALSPTSSSSESSDGGQLPTKSQRRQRKAFRKSGKSAVFRRMTSRRNLKKSDRDGLVKEKNSGPQPSRTFSMSDDDASHVSSLLFSPVNNNIVVSASATSPQQSTVLLTTASPRPPVSPLFFVSRQERLLKKCKLKLTDAVESIGKKDAEIECLKKAAEDAKELYSVELELKKIELEKKNLELQKAQVEISKLKVDIDEQSRIIEALATSQHEQMNCNWFAALPNLFVDLI